LHFSLLFEASSRKNRSVAAALLHNRWVLDLWQRHSAVILPEFFQAWRLLRAFAMQGTVYSQGLMTPSPGSSLVMACIQLASLTERSS
jgi:hypothetical protein